VWGRSEEGARGEGPISQHKQMPRPMKERGGFPAAYSRSFDRLVSQHGHQGRSHQCPGGATIDTRKKWGKTGLHKKEGTRPGPRNPERRESSTCVKRGGKPSGVDGEQNVVGKTEGDYTQAPVNATPSGGMRNGCGKETSVHQTRYEYEGGGRRWKAIGFKKERRKSYGSDEGKCNVDENAQHFGGDTRRAHHGGGPGGLKELDFWGRKTSRHGRTGKEKERKEREKSIC